MFAAMVSSASHVTLVSARQYNMRQPRAGGKDIGSFLIKPVQRCAVL